MGEFNYTVTMPILLPPQQIVGVWDVIQERANVTLHRQQYRLFLPPVILHVQLGIVVSLLGEPTNICVSILLRQYRQLRRRLYPYVEG